MRTIVFSLIVLSTPCWGQLNTQLYDAYGQYQEKSITTRRFKHNDVMAVLDKLGPGFNVKKVGTSVEGRAIKLVSYGHGPIQVLMWSQMHGDETTATRAILDVLHWLEADDQFNGTRDRIKSAITWHFMPMLNPDGAARFTRRNHYGIDINRDALRLQTPEGRTLKRVRDSLNADWGFNLHDQNRGTSVENKAPATLSLLAPAFDTGKSVNEKRGDAMQLTRTDGKRCRYRHAHSGTILSFIAKPFKNRPRVPEKIYLGMFSLKIVVSIPQRSCITLHVIHIYPWPYFGYIPILKPNL